MIILWKNQDKRKSLLTFFLLLFFISSFGLYKISAAKKQVQVIAPQNTNQVLGIAKQNLIPGLPIRLIIPAINVNARIQDVGIALKGEMEVPSNAVDVGWFKIGTRPGEVGSAVIAGHINGESGETGVFANLYKLKEGDNFYIENDKGTLTFVVWKKQIFDPGYADEVFSRNDGVYLNLITCDGLWDGVKKSYSKRLVVFAVIVR